MSSLDKAAWFSPWTGRTILWVLLALVLGFFVLQWPFVWFFDTMLTDIGFLYVYMWAFPQAALLYFVAFKLRVRWTSTVILGLTGIIGAPIDYYFEWVVERNLISPIFAFMYIPLYIVTGLSADISLERLHPEDRPARAVMISSFILTAVMLFTTAFASFFFYPAHGYSAPSIFAVPWLGVGGFLIPYSLATGVMGGYLGFSIAKDLRRRV
jgi:hypothetical protein